MDRTKFYLLPKTDKWGYLRSPIIEKIFVSCFDIREGPKSPQKWNWNLLSFFPFIFTFEQCDLTDTHPLPLIFLLDMTKLWICWEQECEFESEKGTSGGSFKSLSLRRENFKQFFLSSHHLKKKKKVIKSRKVPFAFLRNSSGFVRKVTL